MSAYSAKAKVLAAKFVAARRRAVAISSRIELLKKALIEAEKDVVNVQAAFVSESGRGDYLVPPSTMVRIDCNGDVTMEFLIIAERVDNLEVNLSNLSTVITPDDDDLPSRSIILQGQPKLN